MSSEPINAEKPPIGHSPVALTIAGSDSSGGAGIQADLKSFAAHGVYGASVITSVTAQNTRGVTDVFHLPGDIISAQIQAVFTDLNIQAVKIGMLGNEEIIEAVAKGVEAYCSVPVILDPVMVATSGDLLLEPGAKKALVAKLFSTASLITPNLHEAANLLDETQATTRAQMEAQAKALLSLKTQAVLLKGGHNPLVEGGQRYALDMLAVAGEQNIETYQSPYIETKNTHGTGCTLSAAIAANIAKGTPLKSAIQKAKMYLSSCLAAADQMKIGAGPGPVHHFWDYSAP